MKRYRLLIFIVSFALSGCNAWLDVSPEDQIGEKELFASGEGYRNALNGIYKSMAEYDCYGRHLTWGIPDAMGQMYAPWKHSTTVVADLEYGAAQYNWNQVKIKPVIENIWSKAYNVVANCNNILRNIETANPDQFSLKKAEKNMIEGEALALRAFIQFDMLRLFAPSPKMNPAKPYIPYVTEYPAFVAPKKKVDECLELIIQDLEKAHELVWSFDSTSSMDLKNRFEEKGVGEKSFLKGRSYRMNAYAIQAVLARVCLYAGRNAEALKYATSLIRLQKEKNYFVFADQSALGDIKNYSDVIFGLFAPRLTDWDKQISSWTDPKRLTWLEIYNVSDLFYPDLYEFYDGATGMYYQGCDDYRYKNFIHDYNYNGDEFPMRKYQEQTISGVKAEVSNTLVPLVRLSEMYYIASEILGAEDRLEEAISLLCDVKRGRGLPESDLQQFAAQLSDYDGLMYELLRDARREFIGEGQIFYMYKRLARALTGLGGNVFPTEENYVIPLPENELNVK